MEIAFWIVIGFAIIYEPIVSYFDFQKFKIAVKENERARTDYYINSIVGLWLPTIFILMLVIFSDLTLQQIGLSLPHVNTETLGLVPTYIVLGIGLIYFLSLNYYIFGYRWSEKIRQQVSEAKKKQMEQIEFAEILPTTSNEKRWWNVVSFTAGVTEEIIYRGFLIFAISYLFPNFTIWVAIFVASFLFGLAHTYQGWSGVLRTTLIGIIFSMIYVGMESVLPLILLHFVIDYSSKMEPIN